MRRLPVYLLLDTSGSMYGESIAAVNVWLHALAASLRGDPSTRESVHVCIMTFAAQTRVVVPLTSLDRLVLPEIITTDSGPTCLGFALKMLCGLVDREAHTAHANHDWEPLLFLVTDGVPTDLQLFEEQVPELRRRPFGNIVACTVGPMPRREYLARLTTNVVTLETLDSSSFTSFVRWVSPAIRG